MVAFRSYWAAFLTPPCHAPANVPAKRIETGCTGSNDKPRTDSPPMLLSRPAPGLGVAPCSIVDIVVRPLSICVKSREPDVAFRNDENADKELHTK